MTSQLYQEWLRQWDRELGAKRRKILLLQDNFSGHIVPEGLQNICVENFSPNLTAHIQPMDQGIIRCFKAHYRARYIQRAIDHYDRGVTPSMIYDIDQLEAMRLAEAAWEEVDSTTIQHCWRKANILPDVDSTFTNPTIPVSSLLEADSASPARHQEDHPFNPVANAENEVENALDELVSTGALHKANRMGIEQLLNPVDEAHAIEATDEEICKAVLDAQKAREDAVINGGDDIDTDDAPCAEAPPTYREVLEAAAVINKYVCSLDSALARELEAKLAMLSRQIRRQESRNLTTTRITNYFPRA